MSDTLVPICTGVPAGPMKISKFCWVPSTEEILKVEYRWVPGSEEISEVGYRWVPGTDGNRPGNKMWEPTGTGYQSKKNWVPVSTVYRSDKKLRVPTKFQIMPTPYSKISIEIL